MHIFQQCLPFFFSVIFFSYQHSFSHSTVAAQSTSSTTSVDLQAIELYGSIDAGSLYAMQDLTKSYTLVQSDLSFSLPQYLSSQTINDMISQSIDFGVVLNSISSDQIAAGPNLVLLPCMLTGLVPTYKISSLPDTAPALVLSRIALAKIFQGVITTWNHPLIANQNPALSLPNQTITVLLDAGASGKSLLLKQALSSFDAIGFNSSGMTLSTDSDFPVELYANYAYISTGTTNLVSATEATDGSISINFAAVAASSGVRVASMINQAGTTVEATPQSFTFAAVEKGTNTLTTRTSVTNLMDPTSSSSWTMTVPSYLLLDTVDARSTCRAKSELVQFFLYIYQSPVAAAVLNQRGYAVTPDVIVSELDIINFLSSSVLCGGTAVLPVVETSTRDLGVTGPLLFLSNLLTSIYVSQDSSVTWQTFSAEENILVEKIVASELDLAFVNPANVNPTLWTEVQASADFLLLPTFAIALSVFLNPQISPTLSITGQTLIVSRPILTQLIIGCITNYNDPQLTALNPWLDSLVANQSVPITKIYGCTTAANAAPITTYILSQVSAFLAANPTLLNGACPNWRQLQSELQANVAACNDVLKGSNLLQFATPETTLSSLVLGVIGGLGFVVADGDANKIFPSDITQNQTVNGNQTLTLATPSTSGIGTCAKSTFNSALLSFNFSAASPSCWPFTLPIVAVMRTNYYSAVATTNASSCSRGLDALSFMSWLIDEANIVSLVAASNIVQLSRNAQVLSAYTSAINTVLCDDKTLFITLPINWQLNSGIYGFSLFASILGFVYVLCLAAFVLIYHKHSVIRAASPLFILISLFGVALIFSGIIALVSNVTTASCIAVAWLFNLGLMIAYAPLFVKAWRIYRIFSVRKLRITKISNRQLLIIISALISLEVLLLSIWQGLSPLKPLLTVDASKVSGVPDNDYLQCGVTGVGGLIFALIGVEKGLLFGFGALISFATRKVVSSFNESSQIAISIYFALFSIAIVAPVVLVIKAQGDILIALLLMVSLLIAYFLSSMLVVPKMLTILVKEADGADASKADTSLESFSFISLDLLSSLSLISSYLRALQTHQEAVKARQAAFMRRKSNNEKDNDKPSIAQPELISPSTQQRASSVSSNNKVQKIVTTNNYVNTNNSNIARPLIRPASNSLNTKTGHNPVSSAITSDSASNPTVGGMQDTV